MVEATTAREVRSPAGIGQKLDWRQLAEESYKVPGALSTTYSRFKEGGYSMGNCILLYLQGARGPVNTYKRWNEMDHQVVKGSKAYAIYVPLIGKAAKEDGTEEQRLKGFKLLRCLFEASQTTGPELPPAEPRTWDKAKALGELAITEKPYTDLDGNAQGVSWDKNLAISPVARYPLKTLFHECGHIVLGHTTPDQLDEYRQHRGLKEWQAETVAYIAMNELGLQEHMDMAESRAYCQGWLQGNEPAEADIRQVFTATDRILQAGWVEA